MTNQSHQNVKEALVWITDILRKYSIPFQITGGLAAILHGSKRPLEDIDIDIPEDTFALITNEVQNYIIYGPEIFKNEKWNILLMTLNYQGQSIDLSGAYHSTVFNEKTHQWETLPEYLSRSVIMTTYELTLPIISRDDLLAYKAILARDVDLIDMREIEQTAFFDKKE
jgi:hypothetical protein